MRHKAALAGDGDGDASKNIIGIMLRERYGRDTSHVGSEGTGLNLVNST